ncbi:ETC complex I subunit [Roseomonas fluvialis]|uniref:ETC complex I subunit n=1 Tax=Roseomonas fluvialis TaxID=1750527 RepID=A0ABM7Y2X6_9PROT|nr:ETC complex I subunit [Roseomonas fluvialis]BDG72525.1 hypothetical protein Rmf_24540 [Roseomonas fluvialis]
MAQHKGLARIFQPPKSAMQSGRAKAQGWVLSYEPAESKVLDPLTGWYGSGDMLGQVRLQFDTRDQAVAYALAQGIAYEVEAPPARATMKPKVYAENFRFGRAENWSH